MASPTHRTDIKTQITPPILFVFLYSHMPYGIAYIDAAMHNKSVIKCINSPYLVCVFSVYETICEASRLTFIVTSNSEFE